ncbi:MAG: response regulator, partial [Bacteroidota bacterium]|nr:response regulator [Bacteroidota bacterium]
MGPTFTSQGNFSEYQSENFYLKVLCIEDNTLYNEVLRVNLVNNIDYKFIVSQAFDLSEGINQLKKENYHIILLDLGLPDSEGLDTLTTIAKVSGSTPIIILTGSVQSDFAYTSLRMGAQDYILKDELDSKILIKSIIYSIQRKKFELELFQTNLRLNFHIENSPLAVVELDEKLDIIQWSAHANTLFNKKASKVLGKKISDIELFVNGEWEKFEDNIKILLNGNLHKSIINVKMIGKEDKIIYAECYNTIFFNHEGEVISILCLINDISFKEASEMAILLGQELERKRVAREIHDGIGQMLVAIKFNLNQITDDLDKEELEAKINLLDELLGKAINEARSISMNIADREAEKMSIEAQGRRLCEDIKKLTGIDITFIYIEEQKCTVNNILFNLYRILQETLNNIVKHSGAIKVTVKLLMGKRSIELKVIDNGNGFNVEKAGFSGRGIKNIHERTASID